MRRLTAQEVIGELRRVHPTDYGEWAFFVEQFQIDAYAIRLWGASGDHPYRRVAYEVKVSRSDFLNELKRPEKRKGALDISHQFYFAMPLELAERCLADVAARAAECGLVAIHPEPLPLERQDRAGLCKGAGYAPCVKILRRAPIRACRGFTDWQIINLIRKADREPTVDEALHEAALAKERMVAERRRARTARDEAEALRKQLGVAARHLIVPDSTWERNGERSTVVRLYPTLSWAQDPLWVEIATAAGGLERIQIGPFLADWVPAAATPARPAGKENDGIFPPADDQAKAAV